MQVEIPRRGLLLLGAASTIGWMTGCSGSRAASGRAPFSWRLDETTLLKKSAGDLAVVSRGGSGSAVLRKRAREVPADLDLSDVAKRMERAMNASKGVGIAGPQVGLGLRVTTLMLDYKTEHPRTVFVRNPVIVERSDETIEGYEGCLSIPDVGGLVRRNTWIRVEYQGQDGQPLKTEAEGPNAVLWQHELDHLDGILYVDKVLGELLPMEEVRRLRKLRENPLPEDPPAAGVSHLSRDPLEGSFFQIPGSERKDLAARFVSWLRT